MKVLQVAAVTYAVLTTGVVVFQIALALGVPWGSYAMGGAFPGRYPPAMRLTALAQAVILALLALVVLSRAGLVLPHWSRASTRWIWIVVVVGVIGLMLNLLTPSAGERRLWAPATLLLLVCSLIVALTAGP